MQTNTRCSRISIEDGWLICPSCGAKLMHILPATTAQRLPVFCRKCKREHVVNIESVPEAVSPAPLLVESVET